MICAEEGLVWRRMFTVDGCRVFSNCAKEWSGTRANLERKDGKLEGSIRFLLRKHWEVDESEGGGG
jgi:hypothetical protein